MSKQHMSIHSAKESSGSLVDTYVSVQLFNASLKALGDLACHAKWQKLLGHLTPGSQHMIQ